MYMQGSIIAALLVFIGGCEPPSDIAPEDTGIDPLTIVGQCETPDVFTTSPLTLVNWVDPSNPEGGGSPIHLLDIEYDPELETAYATGTGGFMAFGETENGIEMLGKLQQGQGGGGGAMLQLEVLGGGLVAGTNRNSGLRIIDVNDPENIFSAASISLINASGIARSGTHLFVLTYTGDLIVYDASSLDDIPEVGSLSTLSNPWDLVIKGDLAFVADNTLGVVVVDISDPQNPSISGEYPTAGGIQELEIHGDYLYAAVGAAGIEVFDISTLDTPVSLGNYPTGRSIISVSASGDALWAATQEGVQVFDISERAQPISQAYTLTDSFSMHVAAIDGKAWVAAWSEVGLFEYDDTIHAPVLEMSPDELYFYNDISESEITITNQGGADLSLSGLLADDPRFDITIDAVLLEPGESTSLRVSFLDDGESIETTLCIASNDPTQAILNVPISTSLSDVSLALGQPAVDFVLPDLEGNLHQLSSHLGKPILLAYFATW